MQEPAAVRQHLDVVALDAGTAVSHPKLDPRFPPATHDPSFPERRRPQVLEETERVRALSLTGKELFLLRSPNVSKRGAHVQIHGERLSTAGEIRRRADLDRVTPGERNDPGIDFVHRAHQAKLLRMRAGCALAQRTIVSSRSVPAGMRTVVNVSLEEIRASSFARTSIEGTGSGLAREKSDAAMTRRVPAAAGNRLPIVLRDP